MGVLLNGKSPNTLENGMAHKRGDAVLDNCSSDH